MESFSLFLVFDFICLGYPLSSHLTLVAMNLYTASMQIERNLIPQIFSLAVYLSGHRIQHQ